MSVTTTVSGRLPAVRIGAADGAQALVTLYGGQLLSWLPADGRQRLFCSAKAALDGSRAIRGGVPVIFPQFAEQGSGMRHGFARTSVWRLAGSGLDGERSYAELVLNERDLGPAAAGRWPHPFELRLRVALRGAHLEQTLTVHNTGGQAFPFAAALHSYFLVDQLPLAGVAGLAGGAYAEQGRQGVQREALLRFDGKLDRIYRQVAGPLTLHTAAGAIGLELRGFTDAVVWNPGPDGAADDMRHDDFRRFACLEAALIGPHQLAAGASWTGSQQLRALS